MGKFLIFDLGTTYFKTCLFDEQGRLIGVCRIASPLSHGPDERVELDVETFKRTIQLTITQLREKSGSLHDVMALSFATQANSFTLLDQDNNALTPFLMWNDGRARGENLPLQELAHSTNYYRTTGVPSINHEFLPAKIHWLTVHEPVITAKTHRLTCISDYLTLWLTGQHKTEASVAWLTGLVNIHEAIWWSVACEKQSICKEWLPEIVLAGTDLGPLLPTVADELGLSRNCRFVVGCLDQFAGAIGVGNVVPGMVSETTGTVLATVRCSDKFEPNLSRDVFQGPTLNSSYYYQMVFSNISGALLENYRNTRQEHCTFAELDELAQHAGSAMGLKWDQSLHEQSLFANRTAEHAVGYEVYAILEAVADELAKQVDMLCGLNSPKFVRSAGGATASELWQQIKTEKVGCPVEATACVEPTSLGAAILANHAIHGTSLKDLSREWVTIRPAVTL